MDYRSGSPRVLVDFLAYHETIRGHSEKTVNEYYLDLRTFFRFLLQERGLTGKDTPFEEIDISGVTPEFLGTVTLTEVYSFLAYLARDREKNPRGHSRSKGLSAASRARKIATLRSFYKYLTVKTHLLEDNPLLGLDSPKVPKSLPRYLTLEESVKLLNSVDSRNRERDYCIICLFLNCGLRVSEIVGLNISDIREDRLRIHGKGSKERTVYLNESTVSAINDYHFIRKDITGVLDPEAFFLSSRRQRMSRETVHAMVKKALLQAGIDPEKYSSHKLRHTAATLMLSNGVDVRTLQEVLGHENLNTTQIYTHVDNTGLRIAAQANPLATFQKDASKKIKKEGK